MTEEHEHQKMIGPTEVARRLNVSRKTIHNWIIKGILPAYKVGGIYRVYVSDLDNLKQSGRVIPPQDVKEMEPIGG